MSFQLLNCSGDNPDEQVPADGGCIDTAPCVTTYRAAKVVPVAGLTVVNASRVAKNKSASLLQLAGNGLPYVALQYGNTVMPLQPAMISQNSALVGGFGGAGLFTSSSAEGGKVLLCVELRVAVNWSIVPAANIKVNSPAALPGATATYTPGHHNTYDVADLDGLSLNVAWGAMQNTVLTALTTPSGLQLTEAAGQHAPMSFEPVLLTENGQLQYRTVGVTLQIAQAGSSTSSAGRPVKGGHGYEPSPTLQLQDKDPLLCIDLLQY